MSDGDVRAAGFQELSDKLYSLASPETQDKIQRRALVAGGRVIKEELQAATPVRTDKVYGNSRPAGELKRSIRLTVRVPKDGTPASATVNFGKLTHIAHIVDIGHLNANATKGGRTHTPAHPFIRGAEERSRARAADAYLTTLKNGINKALKKTEKAVKK